MPRALIPGVDAEAATVFGRNLVGERLHAYLADESVAQPTSGNEALSPRESEVAGLVADGLTHREIAHRLHTSVRTVDAHLDRIRSKLDVRSGVQIATWITDRDGTPP
ncbi:response regulator transcription factor [Streptantibioticus rubrisoli]|uniref:Helix-turn-helix transcriptional regulator n=1 Tax=Streptantibioticus rubrisoli TaxID=1387313 RepID=A0ABT1P6Y8_9ACTN|nr:helix-turn-helix transcriptional regulator [Streptantibioticus rubrisoli]MCQ4040516.1 helix-turn-helix transcriptional regulator [Streptantibioticus rubrisoli]